MREFAMVGAWALFAIFIRHKESLESVAYFALAGCVLLVVTAGLHGYRNRATNPFNKLKQRFNN